jgi:pimeloyl-ACP methyl ester carboxylesterase
VAVVLSGCEDEARPSAIDTPPEIPQERLPPTTADFEAVDCPFAAPSGYAVQCGWVTVPADHSSKASSELRLFVSRYFSNAPEVNEDPILYLEGGPGGDATSTVLGLFDYFEPLLTHRDLVTFDQRGAGASEPSLACDELRGAAAANASDKAALVLACRSRLTAAGIELDQFNTRQNAADVETVRLALGYQEWNLLGVSYGTRLALTVMRDAPAAVRSVVLDSTVPLQVDLLAETAPNAQAAFERLFAACAADADCAEAYPDPMGTLLGIVERLDASPVAATFSDGSAYQLTGKDVLGVVFSLLYAWGNLPYIPRLIADIDQGDYELVLQAVEESWAGGFSEGMYLSVNCSEEAAFTSAATVTTAAAGLDAAFADYFADPAGFEECAAWAVSPAPAVENQPVDSGLPTLVLSGYFDPVTPPRFGQLVAADLSNSQHLELAGASHGVVTTDCGVQLMDQFFLQPGVALEAACVPRQSGPHFVLTAAAAQPTSAALPAALRFRLPGEPRPPVEQLLDNLMKSRQVAGGGRRW